MARAHALHYWMGAGKDWLHEFHIFNTASNTCQVFPSQNCILFALRACSKNCHAFASLQVFFSKIYSWPPEREGQLLLCTNYFATPLIMKHRESTRNFFLFNLKIESFKNGREFMTCWRRGSGFERDMNLMTLRSFLKAYAKTVDLDFSIEEFDTVCWYTVLIQIVSQLGSLQMFTLRTAYLQAAQPVLCSERFLCKNWGRHCLTAS